MNSRPLTSRPQADVIPVEDLVVRVQEGRIRIPNFQRPPRWRAQHVEALFDSLWQGYPVGNLLFWRRPAATSDDFVLGALEIHAEARPDALWVVDGQQRLTALAAVLLHPHPTVSAGDIFALWFDLEEQKFCRPALGETIPSHWLPMNRIVDAVALGEWWNQSHELSGRSDLYRVALQLGKRIRESKFPVYTVETEDADALKIIFARLNTAGVAMRETEVFSALHTMDGQRGPLEVLRDVSREAGMGTMEDEWNLRCIRLVAGEALDTKFTQELEHYRDHVGRTSIALGKALDFLKNQGHVPHLRLMPNRLPVVVLTQFFHRFREPADRTLVLLRRWLWRGFVNRRHQATDNPHLRILSTILYDNEHESVQRLLGDLGGTQDAESLSSFAHDVVTEKRQFSSAYTKIYCILLSWRKPRHVETGETIDLGQLFDDLGPGAVQHAGKGRKDKILHAYLEDPEKSFAAASEEVRFSHYWATNQVEREDLLTRSFQGLLRSWCEPGMPDGPPMDSLLEGLEEE